MEHRPEELRERRAARARVLRARRRRRRILAALVVGLLVLVVVLAMGAAGGSRKAGRAGPAPSAPVPGAPASSQARTGSASQADLAAVRRLAGYGLPMFCGGRSKRMVALTFDDGPGPYTTLAIRKLREKRLRATFFLVGKEIQAHPGLAQLERPVAAFGDHTMTHPFLPALPPAAIVQEIAGAQALIEQATGKPVALFRPPYEGVNQAINGEVKALGMLEVLWSVDSADSLGANYAGIERNVIAGLHPGSIILMHENRGQTIRALPVIFAALARDHLQAVTVPELVAADPPSPTQLRAGFRGCGVKARAGNGA